jgi:hypothetical protein
VGGDGRRRLRKGESNVAVPSIKGAAFAFVVEKVLRLVTSGEISRSELARRLPSGGLEAIDRPVVLVAWYDIRIYAALMELLRDVIGGSENEYLVRHGGEAAERLLQKGFYQQMEYLKRMAPANETDPHIRYQGFGRDLRRLASLSPSILNFGQLKVRVDPEYADRYMLEASDGSAFPEVLCWSMQGFYNRMAAAHDSPELWRLDRPHPNIVRHRMTRPI